MRCLLLFAALAPATALPLAPGARQDVLAPPVRLTAGDAPIDVGEHVGHAGPLFWDVSGDDLPDLLVGTFRGHVAVYRNTGTHAAPAFEDAGLLQAGGEDLKIPNW